MTDPVPATNGFDMNRPTIICLLYLASFVVGISGIVGVVLAFIWKDEPHEPWQDSHFRFLIRSFWMGIILGIGAVIATVASFFLLGWLFIPLVAIWFIVRTVKALLAAQKHEPIVNPDTWLF